MVKIGTAVTSIGDHAFYECESLYSVTIPSTVSNVDYDVFLGCVMLDNTDLSSIAIDQGGWTKLVD